MSLYASGDLSKVGDHMGVTFRQIDTMLNEKFPKLFENAENTIEPPIDDTILRIQRNLARTAAITATVEELEEDPINVEVDKESGFTRDDKIAINVAERYSDFLKNPDKLKLYIASKAR